MQEIEADKVLRLGMLFHDIGKPQTLTIDEAGIIHNKGHADAGERIAKDVLRRLKFDNDTLEKVVKLVRYHDQEIGLTASGVRRAVNRIGEDIFPMLFAVRYADIQAQSNYMREEKLEKLAQLRELYDGICRRQECISLKDLTVTGSDLIALGMSPGREIGELLKELLDLVLENPHKNTRDELLRISEKKIRNDK